MDQPPMPWTPDERDELLTVKQYAERVGVHPQTVYTAIRLNQLRFGSVVRITDDVIRIAVPRHARTQRRRQRSGRDGRV